MMRLSTPSLGITYADSNSRAMFRTLSFNSLSRDHPEFAYAVLRAVVHGIFYFQLPLSGSHVRSCALPKVIYYLSTPSLGITNGDSAESLAKIERDFQLPLSGSLWARGGGLRLNPPRPFNSLSRDHIENSHQQQQHPEHSTFNSLSRDH